MCQILFVDCRIFQLQCVGSLVVACGIYFSDPRIELGPPTLEEQSLSHWATGDIPPPPPPNLLLSLPAVQLSPVQIPPTPARPSSTLHIGFMTPSSTHLEQTHHCGLNSGHKIPTSASTPSGTLSQWVGFALLHDHSRLCTSSIPARSSLCLHTRV